jgi:hypothetical protein
MYTCPENHASETADFCSVCGVEIPPPGAGGAAGELCPTCGTAREGLTQAFCEACGHNYRTGTRGAPPPPQPVAPAARPAVRWDVVVRVDPNLYGKPNPDAPTDQPPQTFTLFDAENMIGREGTGVRLQVPIRNDPGVSRRQALLLRQPDGGLLLRDLNSANGTQVNGAEVVPGADVPLRDGDSIAVGAWTRLAVRAVIS